MNKADLAQAVAEKLNLPKRQIEEVLHELLQTIVVQLTKGEEVVLTGFGAFSAKKRAARQGVNPQNPSEKIQIPAVTVPKFKAGKGLKDALK
jgi:DNA-binding protein HU-beta